MNDERETFQRVQRQARQDLEQRIDRIRREHAERDRQIRREGATLAWLTCPFAAWLFGMIACFEFLIPDGSPALGYLYAGASLFSLMLLVVAVSWSRWQP